MCVNSFGISFSVVPTPPSHHDVQFANHIVHVAKKVEGPYILFWCRFYLVCSSFWISVIASFEYTSNDLQLRGRSMVLCVIDAFTLQQRLVIAFYQYYFI